MLQRERISRHFVLADDENVSRAHLVGRLKRFLQAERFVAQPDNQIVPPQFASHARSFAIHPGTKRRDVNIGLADHRFRRRGLHE